MPVKFYQKFFSKKNPEISHGLLKDFACQRVRMLHRRIRRLPVHPLPEIPPGPCPAARQTPNSTAPTLPYLVIILRREIAYFYAKLCRFLEKHCHFPGKTGLQGS